jgi:hypothetical protein
MKFVHQWSPLLVTIREEAFDQRELTALSSGFEQYFQRGERHAWLDASHVTAEVPDPITRIRFAEWLNDPKVRRNSKELCVGSATVVARVAERNALTALQWLWAPEIPHDAVQRVSDGIDFCIDRLVAAKVPLPMSPEQFREHVYRGLSSWGVAGMADAGAGFDSVPPRRPSVRRRSGATPGRFETLADRNGCVVFGWLVPGVLWCKFAGHLSETLCAAHASRLSEILKSTSSVRYFQDSRALESCDPAGRNATLCALMENAGHLAQVVVSEWADELNPTSRAMMLAFGSSVQLVSDYREFEARLLEAAPGAREILRESRLAIEMDPSPSADASPGRRERGR